MMTASTKTRTVEAPAKVNLFLRVLGLRPDGYHELETLIAPISLTDRLEIHADAGPTFRTLALSLEVTGEPDCVRDVPSDDTNLVVRAAYALAERTGVRGFADVSLEKRVPSAAGLGGGSSDAAATLRALNELWDCRLDDEALVEVAASVGSDVPALLFGGPVLARGRGELVEPSLAPALSLTLVTFAFGISTPEAFRWWDEDGGPAPSVLDRAILQHRVPSRPPLFGTVLGNYLEDPVGRRHPVIQNVKAALLEGGAVEARMTGSGPTVFGILASEGERLDPSTEREIETLAGRAPRYVTTVGLEPGSYGEGTW